MLRTIVCDWNGTLYREPLEETYFFGLCRQAFWRAARRGRLDKLAGLMTRGVRCLMRYRAAKGEPHRVPEHIAEIVELLNPAVFAGLRREELDAYTRRYARRIQPMLDGRLLGPLTAVASEKGIPVGVVSSGCRIGIEAALAEAGCPVTFVVANEFRMDGDRTAGFEFAVGDNKCDLLAELLSQRGIDPAEVMYIGDSPQDEACFRLVGMPVLSFWARPDLRARLAADGTAFAPPDASAFEAYLREAAG